MGEPKNLHITLTNSGEKKVSGVYVVLGKYRSTSGLVVPSTSSRHRFFNHPLTETATVFFMDQEGNRYTKTVQIKGEIPDEIIGNLELIFKIDSNTNEVALSYSIEEN